MPTPTTPVGQRYPCFPYARVLLPRTRLAYIHLRNLLTDAKRDRGARISGYVEIWLPEDVVVLYLLGGEVVNATMLSGKGQMAAWKAVAVTRAIDKIPTEPEYGEICFHEADQMQLGAMFQAQVTDAEPWPAGLAVMDPGVLFSYLASTTFDGVLEVSVGSGVNYILFQYGNIVAAFFADHDQSPQEERLGRLFQPDGRSGEFRVRRWKDFMALPIQAPPGLVQAYRELTTGLVQRLVDGGRTGAPAIAEQARQSLLVTHPVLDGFSVAGRPARDPIADTAGLTAGVSAWISEVVWAAADHDALAPEVLLRELTWERRHMFQSAGLYESIPWRVL